MSAFRIASGSVNATDSSSAKVVVSAITGSKLSLRTVTLSNSGTAAQNIKVQSSAATPLVFMQHYLAANTTWSSPILAPGAYITGATGESIDILASTTNAVSADIEAYAMN